MLAYAPLVAQGSPATAPPPNTDSLIALMKTDLRNLVTAEEAFFADSVKYTSKVGPGGLNFTVSSGNTGPTIVVTADGWTAVIGNAKSPTRCTIFIGSTSTPPAVKEGVPKCQ